MNAEREELNLVRASLALSAVELREVAEAARVLTNELTGVEILPPIDDDIITDTVTD